MRTRVPSLTLLGGLRSGMAVAVAYASSYSSNLTPSLGTSICQGCSPKKTPPKKVLDCLKVFWRKLNYDINGESREQNTGYLTENIFFFPKR